MPTGSDLWTAFFALLLLEAVLVAMLVALAMRQWPASRRAGSLVLLGVVAAPLAILLHNVASALTGGEEPVTFVVGLVVAPLAVVAGTFAVARSLRTADRDLAVGLGLAGLGLALFPLYAIVAIAAGPIVRATEHQGALEAVLLPMSLVLTAIGIAYTGIVLIRPRLALG